MYYCYQNYCTFRNEKVAMRFIKSDTVTVPTVSLDENNRIDVITYPENTTLSELSTICTPDEGHEGDVLDIVGDLYLFYQHTVNGLTFTLIPSENKDQTYLFSCLIDNDTETPYYEENDVGGWVVLPATYEEINNLDSTIVSLINSSSTLFHATADNFTPANILGVDLREKRVKTTWSNTIPYGDYQRLYVNEAEIITAFIKEMKRSYPEIEFFPQSSERKNLGHETVFYRSALSRDRSERFNSIILQSEESGRFYYTTIPLELFYQTNDVAQYSERRSAYLLYHFFMDVIYFDMVKPRGYDDKWGPVMEPFKFAVYWDRDVEDNLIRADSTDGSGRDTYTLTFRCDLICTLIERSDETYTIHEVLTYIYAHSRTESGIR